MELYYCKLRREITPGTQISHYRTDSIFAYQVICQLREKGTAERSDMPKLLVTSSWSVFCQETTETMTTTYSVPGH